MTDAHKTLLQHGKEKYEAKKPIVCREGKTVCAFRKRRTLAVVVQRALALCYFYFWSTLSFNLAMSLAVTLHFEVVA